MGLKDWINRDVSDFERKNYMQYKWHLKTSNFKRVEIYKDNYGDFSVSTPDGKLNVYPKTMSRALAIAKSYMANHGASPVEQVEAKLKRMAGF